MYRIAAGFGVAGLGLAPFRRAFEGRADVGHFLHARANGREIRIGFHATGRRQIDRSRLIPVDAIGPNDVVERPALLREALGRGRHLCLGACDTMRDCQGCSGPCRGHRTNEAASIHDPTSRCFVGFSTAGVKPQC
jgi:hypothetical protein